MAIDRNIDTTQPSTARMYDFLLGGKDNYEVDRIAAQRLTAQFDAGFAVRTNRAFMHRATRYLAQAGVRQFLDIGTGIPTQPNLHQVAQAIRPDARVVYVDNDPIVLAHARALMDSTPEGRTKFIDADVNQPEGILAAPELRTLDFSQPVALSLIALMHFVSDELRPYETVATLLGGLAPGSYLVMSQSSADWQPEVFAELEQLQKQAGISMAYRSRDEFGLFFDGLTMVEPGLTTPHRWRPDPAAEDVRVLRPGDSESLESLDRRVSMYVGVALKP